MPIALVITAFCLKCTVVNMNYTLTTWNVVCSCMPNNHFIHSLIQFLWANYLFYLTMCRKQHPQYGSQLAVQLLLWWRARVTLVALCCLPLEIQRGWINHLVTAASCKGQFIILTFCEYALVDVVMFRPIITYRKVPYDCLSCLRLWSPRYDVTTIHQ